VDVSLLIVVIVLCDSLSVPMPHIRSKEARLRRTRRAIDMKFVVAFTRTAPSGGASTHVSVDCDSSSFAALCGAPLSSALWADVEPAVGHFGSDAVAAVCGVDVVERKVDKAAVGVASKVKKVIVENIEVVADCVAGESSEWCAGGEFPPQVSCEWRAGGEIPQQFGIVVEELVPPLNVLGMSSLAPEFFPSGSLVDASVPTFGAQLDYFVQTLVSQAPCPFAFQKLCEKVEVLELQNKELADKLAMCNVSLWEVAKQGGDTGVSMESVLAAVVDRLPSVMTTVVSQALSSSLRDNLQELVPVFVKAALLKEGVGGGLLEKEPAVGVKELVKEESCKFAKNFDTEKLHKADEANKEPEHKLIADEAKAEGSLLRFAALTKADEAKKEDEDKKMKGVLDQEESWPRMSHSGSPIVLVGDGLVIGEAVFIDGLVSSPALNGCVARILGYDAQTGRYMLELEHGKGKKKLKRENFITEEDMGDCGDESCGSGSGCHDVVYDDFEEVCVDAGGVVDVGPVVSGTACLDDLQYRSMTARSLSV
jgi:hypothetical protein